MKTAKLCIKNVLLVFRNDTSAALKLATDVCSKLNDLSIKPFSHPQQKITGCKQIKDISSIDLVIVLGGDGTYLEAVRLLEGRKTPILGINLGSLGFLTNTLADNAFSMIDKALNCELEMRPRSMLEVIIKKPEGKFKYTALNDIVFERGAQSQLLNLSVFSQEHLITSLKSDGLIFASPTGSTAYNLAAGGPILHPEVKAYIMTPICAHSLTARPTIFPDNEIISIKINNTNQSANLTVDGQVRLQLTSNDQIILKKANCDHSVLREPSHNYFSLLREKLKFGERA